MSTPERPVKVYLSTCHAGHEAACATMAEATGACWCGAATRSVIVERT